MGKMQRNKGARWEREVARALNEAMPGLGAKRGFQTRGGAAEAADVECEVFHVECKVGAKPPVRQALVTAVDTAPDGRLPLAVIKEDRKPPFVVMQWDDFLDLIGEWWERGRA